jgi:hypothetical protein
MLARMAEKGEFPPSRKAMVDKGGNRSDAVRPQPRPQTPAFAGGDSDASHEFQRSCSSFHFA